MSGVVAPLLYWTLAGVFGLAVLHKVRTGERFWAVVHAYGLTPKSVSQVLARGLPWVEAAIAGGLVLWWPPAAAAAGCLLFGYALAMSIALLRGRKSIDCGCGEAPTPVHVVLVLRNALLVAAAAWLATGANVQVTVGALTAAAGAAFLVASIEAGNQLLANRFRMLTAGIGHG